MTPTQSVWRFAALLSALAGSLAGGLADAAPAGKPNVVFVVIDDLGRNDLGTYGSTFYKTPHIDRLAAGGMKFTSGYAACPVCSPTRASILTGKYPARLHLTDWLPGRGDAPGQKMLRPRIRQQLPLEEVTLAEALRAAGYATAHVGKWHLGGQGFGPEQQGFDLNVGGSEAGLPRSHFAPYAGAAAGVTAVAGLGDAPKGQYLADRLTDEAEKFIEANKGKPFFLYLAHYGVHTPIEAKPGVVQKYAAAVKPGEAQNNPTYAAMVESIDDSVGRVMKKLADLGLSEKTIVVFTSDNGGLSVPEGQRTPATSNAPLRAGKGYLYEGGVRVPFLVKWPGVAKPGGECDAPACSVDFFPTILEACGAGAGGATPDGVSLVSVLRDGAKPEALERDALYWHYPHYANQGGRPGGAVRAGDWKLIEWYEDGRAELYNLKDDPGEKNDLANQAPDKVAALRSKLAAWRESAGVQGMQPNPKYDPSKDRIDDLTHVVRPAADGSILLGAKDAVIHGSTVRYEPQPHKNTVGYWTKADDWVSWDFTAAKPGTYAVEIVQGCGKGSGGSEVEFSVGGQTLTVTVQDTGGFQNFVPRAVGTVKLAGPGRYTLAVKPRTKPGAAVMDLRSVTLKPE